MLAGKGGREPRLDLFVYCYICDFLMKRLSSLVLLLIVFALLGETAVTSFCPEVLTVAVASADLSEESAEEDEPGEDDKVVGKPEGTVLGLDRSSPVSILHVMPLQTTDAEIVAPPPQA